MWQSEAVGVSTTFPTSIEVEFLVDTPTEEASLTLPRTLPDPDDSSAWRAWADEMLAPMDLSVSLLHQAAEAGQRRMDGTSPLAPRITGGTNRWSETVIAFRGLTAWRVDETDGLSRTVHPSGRFYVVVRTGAGGVGKFGQCPTPKNGLGDVLRRVIDRRPTTLPLLDIEGCPVGEDYQEPDLWLFLTEYYDGLIHSELSKPSARKGDDVVGYSEQIQLPPFPFRPSGDVGSIRPDDRPDDDDDDAASRVSAIVEPRLPLT